jgi:uncharacterized protein
MTNNIRYFTIPGYGDSSATHWQSYFEHQLPDCQRIIQKDWLEPVCADWVEKINQTVQLGEAHNVVLITHSLGGIALAHWANRFPSGIKGALIVAPPDIEHPYQAIPIEGFAPIPLKPLPFPAIVVSSSNDPWATPQRSRHFADCWGSQLVMLDNAGHINADAGFYRWDAGLALLNTLV